ncbi:MAG: TonB-dependent receptor domain-containing protein [Terriglobales bacterium]
MSLMKTSALLALVLFVFASALRAQTANGQVNGTVTDNSGAIITGATVRLTNTGTKVAKQAHTNSAGYFVFINVLPGPYVLSVEQQGFRVANVNPFEIEVNQTLSQNIRLQVGTVTESVTVTTQSPLLQTSSSELGTVISDRAVQELPLNGRNFTQLLILTPGITPVSSAQGSGISATDAGITAIPNTSFYKPSVNGQENRENLFYLDGILNTDIRGAVYGVLPILDTVDEFKVQSHNDKAEFGGTLGGVVNVATKSGTNNFHGSAWEFARSNVFDARDPFNDFCNSPARCPGYGQSGGPTSATPAAPASYSQNQFGGAIGGPIFKNKTFFYGAYEGWRFSQPLNSFKTVPTQSELGLAPGLNGNLDFTGSLQGSFSASNQIANQLYNPYSAGGSTAFQCIPGTGSGTSPFTDPNYAPMTPEPVNLAPGVSYGAQPKGVACDIIPQGLANPQMIQLAQAYFQKPNFTPVYGVQNNNFLDSRQHTDNMNSWQIRLDQNFGPRDTLFLRLSQMWVNDTAPVAGTIASNPQAYHAYNFGGAWDHVFRPNLILDVRAGAMLKPYSFYQNAGLPPGGFKPETTAGFTGIDATQGFFMTSVDGITIGSQAANLRGNPVANADGSINWIKGNHNMKAGVEYIYTNRYQQNNFTEVDYSGNQTSSGLKSQTNQGNNLASALLALPSSFQVQTPAYALVYLKMPSWAGYFEDDWHVKPTFNLSLGLRYDYVPQAGIIGPHGRPLNAIDLYHQQWQVGESASAIADCTAIFVNPCIPGGYSSSNPNFSVTVPLSGQTYDTFGNIVFKGHPASANSITDNWGPRVGISWEFVPNTVLRAGYTIFYDTITARSQWVQNTLLGADWPWTEGSSSLPFNNGNASGGSASLSPMATLIAQGVTPSVATTPWALNQNGGYANDPGYTDARSQQWHVGLERQFGGNTKASVYYVGSKTGRLDWTGNANAAEFTSPLLNSAVTTSAQGVTSCGAKKSATDTPACEAGYYTAVDKMRLMPWGRSDYHYSTSTGYANYNALQAQFERTFSGGLFLLGSYTWSKCLGVSSGWFNVENGSNGGTVTEDYFNQGFSYGPCAFDIPQDATLSLSYALPFGRGKTYMTHGPLSWALGNWETNLFFLGRSGQNFQVTNGGGDPAALSGSGGIGKTSVSGYDRPDVVPGVSLIPSSQNAHEWFNPAALCIIPSSPGQTAPNGSASSICPAGSPVFGNLGVGALRDQFFYNVDFSLAKNFKISEAKSVQIRAEAFNVFNLQILGTPGNNITSGSPGVINSIASTPRELQFAAKFVF